MNRRRENELPLAQEAADWLARLESGERESHAAFLDWVRQSPVHVREFLAVSDLSHRLTGIDPDRRRDIRQLLAQATTNVVPGPSSPLSPRERGERVRVRGASPLLWTAAAIVLIVGALFLMQSGSDADHYATARGEQRIFKLSDGSLIHLNTHTRLEVNFTRQSRALRLLDGEALFVVAKDTARPFRVAAGAAVIEAIGTQFNVYRRAAGTMVAVVEGRVCVSEQTGALPIHSTLEPTMLSAGESARVDAQGQITREMAAVDRAIAWRQRQLEFRETTLAEAAAEFNRYNTLQIRVEGPAVRELQVTGHFNADNPEGLLHFLSKDESLSIARDAQSVTIRAR